MSITESDIDTRLNCTSANEEEDSSSSSNQQRDSNLPSQEKLEEMKATISETVSMPSLSIIVAVVHKLELMLSFSGKKIGPVSQYYLLASVMVSVLNAIATFCAFRSCLT